MRELMEPVTHWIITQADGAVTFTDADGRSRRYVTTNEKEKHQLQSGTIETRTKWDSARLQQEISEAGGLKVLRTYELSVDKQQLIVTSRAEGGPSGGRESPPIRAVYDLDAER